MLARSKWVGGEHYGAVVLPQIGQGTSDGQISEGLRVCW
jgi:hypothetical protein